MYILSPHCSQSSYMVQKFCIVYKADAKWLHLYMMYQLHEIQNLKWWHHIPYKLILEKSKVPSMYNLFTHCNLRWAGHLNCFADCQNKSSTLSLVEGSCKTVRPKLWHKNMWGKIMTYWTCVWLKRKNKKAKMATHSCFYTCLVSLKVTQTLGYLMQMR